jgi:hypothetical protein
VVVDCAAFQKLQDQVDRAVCLEDLVQGDDILVREHPQEFYLIFQAYQLRWLVA